MDAIFPAAAIALLLVAAGATEWLGWAILRRGRQHRSVLSRYEKPLPLARVWDEWLMAPDVAEGERTRREALFTLVEPVHREAVREDLLRFEARALGKAEPLVAIRRELMDSIDRRMLNREILALPENLKRGLRAQSGDVIATDAEAEAYLAANELRLEILREYAARRYGDRAPQDWFEVYERAALLKQRTARSYITRSMSGKLNEEHDARHQAISLVDSQLRAHLLKVAPGTRFERLAERPTAE